MDATPASSTRVRTTAFWSRTFPLESVTRTIVIGKAVLRGSKSTAATGARRRWPGSRMPSPSPEGSRRWSIRPER